MQARAPLMIEHRLIERMICQIHKALKQIHPTKGIDSLFIDTAVDFIRTYADRTHHGKEEDILFRDLNKKDLSADDKRVMNELVEEHVYGRKTTKKLIEANNRYRRGDKSALADITDALNTLVNFYPKHIDKEDKVFFPASRTYLSEQEEQAILTEFLEFDRKMIHEKYKSVVERLREHLMKGENNIMFTFV
jgi:hemerythrin-like domain-containing protein